MSDETPKELVARVRAYIDQTTPKPWEAKWMSGGLPKPHLYHVKRNGGTYTIATPVHSNPQTMANMEFCGFSRTDLPLLADRLEEASKICEEVVDTGVCTGNGEEECIEESEWDEEWCVFCKSRAFLKGDGKDSTDE